jgi:hypothetical protein
MRWANGLFDLVVVRRILPLRRNFKKRNEEAIRSNRCFVFLLGLALTLAIFGFKKGKKYGISNLGNIYRSSIP